MKNYQLELFEENREQDKGLVKKLIAGIMITAGAVSAYYVLREAYECFVEDCLPELMREFKEYTGYPI